MFQFAASLLRQNLLIVCVIVFATVGAWRLGAQEADSELAGLVEELSEGDAEDAELLELLNDPALKEVSEAADLLEARARQPLWAHAVTLELGAGFKQNVALSSSRPEDSPMWRASGEWMLMRAPKDGLEAFFFGAWDDFRYLDSEVDKELTGLAIAEVKKETESGWDFTANAQFIYLNQVIDLSPDFATPISFGIEGSTYNGSLTARRYLRHKTWAEVGFESSRQDFAAPLDGYWEHSPRLELAKWWQRNHLALSYRYTDRPYDSRLETDRNGKSVPGTQLEFMYHRLELDWQQYWGEEDAWKTTTKVRRELRFDNGGGFFRFRRWRVGQKIRYRRGDWSGSAEFTWSTYHYPNQSAVTGLPDRRSREDWNFDLRLDRKLNSHWSVYLAYMYEKSRSNQPGASYHTSLVHAGLVLTN